MKKNKWFLNGGRGSGRTFRLLCETYENKIANLEAKLKHAEENCINKTCVVFKDKEDCVAKLLELEKENEQLTISYETLKLHDEEEIGMLKSENAELKEKLEITDLALDNCLKDSKVEK